MRVAGRITAEALLRVGEAVRPGITTLELDAVARRYMERQGAEPSFLGYHGFPGAICASVNDEVVHGIPSERVLHGTMATAQRPSRWAPFRKKRRG